MIQSAVSSSRILSPAVAWLLGTFICNVITWTVITPVIYSPRGNTL